MPRIEAQKYLPRNSSIATPICAREEHCRSPKIVRLFAAMIPRPINPAALSVRLTEK
jgi:hypothetical protein